MAVIPSFSAFAPQPNLANAYIGGANIALGRERLAQSAAQAASEIELQRQRLAQAAQQNEMELAAKEKAQTAQMLRQQQEMEIEKSYKENMIGLHARELQQSAQKLQMATQQAAQKFSAMQKRSELIALGEDPIKATFMTPEAGVPSGAYSAYERQTRPAMSPTDMGPLTPLLDQQGKPTGYGQAASGPQSRRIIKLPTDAGTMEAKPIPGAPGYSLYGDKVLPMRIPEEVKQARAELKAFDKAHAATMKYITGGEEPPKRDLPMVSGWKNERSNLVKATLPEGLSAAKSASSGPKEVTRRTKSGRLAIYNADTKEFVRYAD